jgi:hypothetical protein
MAHFAELDEDNTVLRVISISNGQILDLNTQQESEEIGIAFCKQLFGEHTRWVQTSINNNFRRCYAGPGYKYSLEKDVFYPPCPNNNMYHLDEETCDWVVTDPELREILNKMIKSGTPVLLGDI